MSCATTTMSRNSTASSRWLPTPLGAAPKRDGRYLLRPARKDPWWKYIWSVRQRVKVGLDGTVSLDSSKIKLGYRPNAWVLRCDHPDGACSFLANEPGSGGKPILLFNYKRTSPFWTI